jgi:hypothetical protein
MPSPQFTFLEAPDSRQQTLNPPTKAVGDGGTLDA